MHFRETQLTEHAPVDNAPSQLEEDELVDPLFSHATKLCNDAFCKLLSRRIGPAKLCLKVQGKTLLQIDDPAKSDQRLIPAPSISLMQLLQQHHLTPKMKIILAYTLARSVWQYYNSDWMGSTWTCESIHFMLEHEISKPVHQPTIHVNKPCFSVRFLDTSDRLPEHCTIPLLIHRYPRVLALGTLLIAIGRPTCVPDASIPPSPLEERMNEDHLTGIEVSEYDKEWPEFESEDAIREELKCIYRTATRSCFDRNIFKPPNDVDIEQHRQILYKRVVWPLESAIALAGWTQALDHIEAIYFKSGSQEEDRNFRSASVTSIPIISVQRLVDDPNAGPRLSVSRSRSPRRDQSKAALFDDEIPPGDQSAKS